MGSSTPRRTSVTLGGASCGGWLLSAVEYVICTPGIGCHLSDQLQHSMHDAAAHGVHKPTATNSSALLA
eukprot:4844447-Prymnesium_polylepis.3